VTFLQLYVVIILSTNRITFHSDRFAQAAPRLPLFKFAVTQCPLRLSSNCCRY